MEIVSLLEQASIGQTRNCSLASAFKLSSRILGRWFYSFGQSYVATINPVIYIWVELLIIRSSIVYSLQFTHLPNKPKIPGSVPGGVPKALAKSSFVIIKVVNYYLVTCSLIASKENTHI